MEFKQSFDIFKHCTMLLDFCRILPLETSHAQKLVKLGTVRVYLLMLINFLYFFCQLALDIWKRKMIEPLKGTLVEHVLKEVTK